MASLNKVLLIGNLGRDPEFKITQSGAACCWFSVATTETWTDKATKDKKEDTEWSNCIIWGAQAEIANKYLQKGKQVFIEGRNRTRCWDDPSGARDGKGNIIKHYRTEVVVSRFLMLGKRDGDGGSRYEPNPGDYGRDAQGGYGDFNVGDLGPPLDDGFEESAPLSPG